MSSSDKAALTPEESEQVQNKEVAGESLKILVQKFLPLLVEIKKMFTDFNLGKLQESFLFQSNQLSEQLATRTNQVTELISKKVGAPSPQLDSLSVKIEQLTAQVDALAVKTDEIAKHQGLTSRLETLALKTEETAKQQGEGINNLSRTVAEVPAKLDQIKAILDRFETLETSMREIQEQQDEIKAIVDAIYKPPEPVATGEFMIRGLKLPPTPPTLKLQQDRDALIKHLEKFKETVQMGGRTGSDINEACANARDGVIQTLVQRGPLVQFFSQLQDTLKPLFRDVLPEDGKKLIGEEINKAIEFYKSAPVGKA